MNNTNKDFTLDIFDILGIFFNQKLVTSILTLIFFLFSLYFTSKFIPKYYFVETFKIQSLSQTESVPIKILNDLIENLLNNNLIVQTLELGEIDLVKYYDKEIKVEPIKSNNLIRNLYSKFKDQELKDKISQDFLGGFSIPATQLTFTTKDDDPLLKEIRIQFTHEGNEEDFYKNQKYQYSKLFIDTAKLLLVEDLRKNISYAIGASKISIKAIIEQLKEQNNQLAQKYELGLIENIYNLKEQALIARELEIENPWDAGEIKNDKSQNESFGVELKQQVFGSSESSSRTDYLRGFKAIEKEIEILESRADIIPYVPQIQSNTIAIKTLEKENFLDENDILSNIGLDDENLEDFRFMKIKKTHYSTSTSFSSYGFNSKQFIFIFTVIGFALGNFYALIYYAYSRKIK